MTIYVNKYFTELEIAELKQIMLEIQEHNGVRLRERTIDLYNKGEAEPRDHKGKSVRVNDLAARAWTMAVLMHLELKGYKIIKKNDL